MDDIKSRLRKAADDFEAMRRHAANMIDSDCEPHWSEQTEMEEASITAVEAAAYIERLETDAATLRKELAEARNKARDIDCFVDERGQAHRQFTMVYREVGSE